MERQPRPRRVAVVVHPTRPIEVPLEALQRWARECEIEIVQIATPGSINRTVAAAGVAESADLLLALGGTGPGRLDFAPPRPVTPRGWGSPGGGGGGSPAAPATASPARPTPSWTAAGFPRP